MVKKSIMAGIIVLMVCSLFVGNGFAQEPKYRFALVVHVAGTPFWTPVKKGAEDAAQLVGVEAQFMGPEEFSIQREVDFLESAIAQGFDGIGVAIADREALDKPIANAREKGIPVIAFNIDDNTTPNERMAFVGQSFIIAGNLVGEHLLEGEEIPEDAEAVVLIGEPGNSALEDRATGIEQILVDKYGIKTERFSAPLADPSTAIDMLKSYIRSHENLKIIAATEFASAFAGKAMEELGMEPGQLLVAGFDLVPDQLDMIKKGYVKFTIDQQPYLQGFQTVMMLYLHKEFGLAPTDINTGVAIVDQSNVDEVVKLSEMGYR
ncbi:substrate-binding domain-containing protein [candidate division KSB3 bacterium]|uniref:Substrate-binding domain-containing protein n=1 Tax=candidate division KSB3 bacterium TaxID=2044937 RepID=A0A9D5JZG7_9BACT|nr:substrate-binding domain-containing protein [candidate division KSB3 bacterium]MBD3326958.1 substrate-binding domain-containing protein [candidate division KSB3 bacterium]